MLVMRSQHCLRFFDLFKVTASGIYFSGLEMINNKHGMSQFSSHVLFLPKCLIVMLKPLLQALSQFYFENKGHTNNTLISWII